MNNTLIKLFEAFKKQTEQTQEVDVNNILIKTIQEYTTMQDILNYKQLKEVEDFFTQNYATTLNVADLAKIQVANNLYIDNEITSDEMFKNDVSIEDIDIALNDYFKNEYEAFFVLVEDTETKEIKLITLNTQEHEQLLETIANADNNILNVANANKNLYISEQVLEDIKEKQKEKELNNDDNDLTRTM